jgi:hypothetical protein
MNRGAFLKTLGLSAGAIAFSPLLSFAHENRVKIYKINTPVFQLTYTDGQKDVFGNLIKHTCSGFVNTMYGTLDERLQNYKKYHIKDEEENISVILYCEREETLPMIAQCSDNRLVFSGEEKVIKYTRACIYKNIQVINAPSLPVSFAVSAN